MKHLKKFEMDFYSGEGSGSVPEKPTGQKLRPYMIDKLRPEGSSGEENKPNLTKTEVLAKIKQILDNSPEFDPETGEYFVSSVESKKGNYLEIYDNKNRSIGIYISEIDPTTYSPPREPYEGIW